MEVADRVFREQSTSNLDEGWQVRIFEYLDSVPFSQSFSYFLSATGPSIKIYSVSTCHVVSTLSIAGTASRPSNPTGYGEAITSMSLNPHNPFQLFTGSLDGCVRVWDFVDAILLQTIDVCYPILYLAAHANFKNEVCVAVSKKTRKLNHNRTCYS